MVHWYNGTNKFEVLILKYVNCHVTKFPNYTVAVKSKPGIEPVTIHYWFVVPLLWRS